MTQILYTHFPKLLINKCSADFVLTGIIIFSLVHVNNYFIIAYSELRNTYSEVRYIDTTNFGYNESILQVP